MYNQVTHHKLCGDTLCMCGAEQSPSLIELIKTSEHDRLMENDIDKLICSDEYQLERSMKSFNDCELNDHLYHIFYSKKTENITLMRRWIIYYVKQYPKQITAKAKPYLESKKLSLEDWLRCVHEGR